MTTRTNPGARVCDKVQIAKWAEERAEQDAAPVIIGAELTETSDHGRDLAHWPRGWYIPVFGTVALFVGARLFWLALPAVLAWALELPIWYR